MTPAEAAEVLDGLGRDLPDRGEGRVWVEHDDRVATVWIDNPRARNALTLAMMAQLARAVDALGRFEGSAVVLAARTSGAFCAGGHLGQVRAAIRGPRHARRMARAMTATLDALLDLPLVSVCALAGPAIGGGAELATATDFRVGTPDARIHFVHGRLGIAPGWGGTGRLVRHLGASRALRILAEAAPIDIPEGARLGLFDGEGPDAMAAATSVLQPVLALDPAAARALKAQVAAARRGDREGEARAFAEVWGGPAHRAALDALRVGRR